MATGKTSSELEIRIKALVEGLDNLKALAAEITRTSDAAKSAGQQGGSAGQEFSQFFERLSAGVAATKQLKVEYQGLLAAGQNLGTGLQQAGQGVDSMAESIGKSSAQAETAAQDYRGFFQSFEQAGTSIKGLSSEVSRAVTGFTQAGQAVDRINFGRFTTELPRASQTLKSFRSDLSQITGEIGQVSGQALGAAGGFASFSRAATGVQQSVQPIAPALGAAATGFRGFSSGGSSAAGALSGIPGPAGSVVNALTQLQQSMSQVEQANTRVVNGFGTLVKTFLLFVGLRGVKELADTAARTETLGVTLEVVGRNAGYSVGELQKYEKEVRQLGITSGAARDVLTRLIQAGIDLQAVNERGASTAARLARASQDLAVVTGENSSDTLQRVVTNISQLDAVGLRFVGLIVNREAAEAQLAQTLGKTADQLTQQQRVQAFLNATLVEADKLTGAYERSLDTVGKKVSSLARLQEELANSVGEALLPAYGALVDSVTLFLKDADKLVQSFTKQTEVANDLDVAFTSVFEGVRKLLTAVLEAVLEIIPAFSGLAKILGEAAGSLLGFVGFLIQGEKSFGVIRGAIEAVGFLVAGLVDGLKILSAGFVSLGQGIIFAFELALKFLASITKFLPGIGPVIADVAKEFEDLRKGAENYVRSTVSDFSNGRSAVQEYAKSLADAKKEQDDLANANSPFSKAEAELNLLTRAIATNKLNNREATDAASAFSTKLLELKSSGDLTGKQFTDLSNKVKRLEVDLQKSVQEKLADAGVALQEFGGQEFAVNVNKQFGELSQALFTLAENAKTTDQTFRQVFGKALGATQQVTEISSLAQALRDAENAGREVGDQVVKLGQTFVKVIDQQLKTASTQQEFKDLAKQVQAVADKFPELGDVALELLDQIDERAKGAGDSLADIAKEAVKLAEGQSQVFKANIDLQRSSLDVARAERELIKAANNERGATGQLYEANLRVASRQLDLARQERELLRARYEQEKRDLDVLIAKQQQLNAERLAAAGKVSQAIALEAAQRAELAEKAAADAQLRVIEQEQVTEETRLTLEVAEDWQDQLKEVEEQQQRNLRQQREISKETQRSNDQAERASTQSSTRGIDLPTSDVSGAKRVLEALKTNQEIVKQVGSFALPNRAIDDFNRRARDAANATIGQARAAERAAEAAVASQQAVGQYFEQIQSAASRAIGLINSTDGAAGRSGAAFTQLTSEVGNAASAMSRSLNSLATVSGPAVAAALEQARASARSLADEARNVAAAFISGNRTLRVELLELQGKEEEAAELRAEARQAELRIQYELLQVQLQIAIAAGRAARVPVQDLQNMLAEANSSYFEARDNLEQILEIERQQRRERRDEAERERQERLEEQNAARENRETRTAALNSTATSEIQGAEQAFAQGSFKAADRLADVVGEINGELTTGGITLGLALKAAGDQVKASAASISFAPTAAKLGEQAASVADQIAQSIAQGALTSVEGLQQVLPEPQPEKTLRVEFLDQQGRKIEGEFAVVDEPTLLDILSSYRTRA